MTVHLFEATSSPSVANFALKQTSEDYASSCGEDAADFKRCDFCVDNGLISVPYTAKAISLIETVNKCVRWVDLSFTSFFQTTKTH